MHTRRAAARKLVKLAQRTSRCAGTRCRMAGTTPVPSEKPSSEMGPGVELLQAFECRNGVVLELCGRRPASAAAVAGVVEDQRSHAARGQQPLDGHPLRNDLADAMTDEHRGAGGLGGGRDEECVEHAAAAGNGEGSDAEAGLLCDRCGMRPRAGRARGWRGRPSRREDEGRRWSQCSAPPRGRRRAGCQRVGATAFSPPDRLTRYCSSFRPGRCRWSGSASAWDTQSEERNVMPPRRLSHLLKRQRLAQRAQAVLKVGHASARRK